MSLREGRHILAYDASCGPCGRFRAVVGFLDARKRLDFVSLETAEESGLLDSIPRASRFAGFHLLAPPASGTGAGGAVSGPEAVFPLLRLLSPSDAFISMAGRAPRLRSALARSYLALSRLHRACPAAAGRDP
jgi:predicted DCC family thiol-disulfide oxidoreductase YuxK